MNENTLSLKNALKLKSELEEILLREMKELSQLNKELEKGEISPKEFKSKIAIYDRSYKETKQRMNEVMKIMKQNNTLSSTE